jgi:beta-lactamase regulating signal transducer with metallopeptidase domain
VSLSQLQPVAQVAVERLLNSLPASLVIAIFAWAVLRILPKQNSRTRFAVWFAALLSVAAVPMLGMLGGATGNLALPASALDQVAGLRDAPVVARTLIGLPNQWAAVIFIAWAFAVALAATRLATGLWRLHQLRRSCEAVDFATLDPQLRVVFDELNATKSFARRSVALATSDQIKVPAALGLWRPTIVLPVWALSELTPENLSIILRHEFAHLRHWDDWTNLI